MTTNLWEADRELSTALAANVVRVSLPSLVADGIRLIGSGWEFDAYLTRDNWVVRFPRRQEMAGLFDTERPIHDLVAEYLPKSIAIPRVEHRGPPSAGFPYNVAAHRYIPGIPVDELDERFLTSIAPQLGAALGALHSIPVDRARALNLVETDDDDIGAREWLRNGLAVLVAIPDRDPIVDGAIQWVQGVSIPTGAFEGPLRVIHQDLSPEHVLADPATGALTGIIDWTDVMLGDPARDFVFLVGWRGWSFTEKVIRHYPLPLDAGFRDRLRFMSRLLTPIWLALAHQRGTEVDKMKRWLHNAYRG